MIKNTFDGLLDDNISPAATRSGRAVNRVGRMTKAGVSRRTQASQMTDNSPTGQTYEERDVEAYQKLERDSEVGVIVTQKQANALIKDAVENQPAFTPNLAK